jgi:predicted transcriptional regulator|tara:strand:+ start:208 stop:462 length:255 start_codon:yes stop_codon:yes gene_type:complete
MALNTNQILKLLKMRALGFNQSEIANVLQTSQQVIAYKLKKLKQQAIEKGTDEVFNSVLVGGLTGGAVGAGVYALIELINSLEQ